MKKQWKMDSLIGPLYLTASKDGLHSILWKKSKTPMLDSLGKDSHFYDVAKMMSLAVKEITEYLNGKRLTFSIPLILEGTIFQKRVWDELKKIPYGETRSYKEIAICLNDKNASRAVGTANGKNPLSLIVPCHRVITSSGKLGGYAGGLDIKTKLLELEKKKLAKN